VITAPAVRPRWAFGNPDRDWVLAIRDREGPVWSDMPKVRGAPVVLAGDLSAVPPADVLQMLHRGRRSGLLVASSGTAQRALLFAKGDLAWASSSEAAERTNETVCRIDLADYSARTAPERAQAALRRQIAAVLSGFLEMNDGMFSMRAFDPGEALEACALNTEEMLLGAMQLCDENQR
jgi:hypothetical protein